MRVRFGLALAAAASTAVCCPSIALAQGQPQTRPTITSLGQDTLSVKAKKGDDSAVAYVPVLNAGGAPATIDVTFQASSSEDVKVSGFTPKQAPPGATRLTVTLTGLKALKDESVDGQLVVTGGRAPVARAVEITPAPQPWTNWPTVIVIGTAIAFALLLFGVGLKANLALDHKAPGPKWSFDSWATTLTTAGAVLGTVLGAATLPDVPRQLSKDSLVGLNLLFGVLVVVGPFVFQALRSPSVKESDQDAGFYGTNGTLLVACAITGAAVLGELATLALLGWELAGPGAWGWLTVAGVGLLAGLAAYYVIVTTYDLVTTDWEAKLRKAGEDAKVPLPVVVVPGPAPETFETLAELWSPPADQPAAMGFLVAPAAVPKRLSWHLP
jgi:hypothetical protein